ncbi:hypothetical protein DPMN_078759, partial [Dreissena polymorpha]
TTGKIGFIMHVDKDLHGVILQIHVDGDLWLYNPKQVTLLTGERFIDILKTHFAIDKPSDENDKLVKAVMRGDAKDVYAIIHQAYTDFRELTSASFCVDHSGNFFVLDAKGERRTFTRDDRTKDISNANARKAVDTSFEFAPDDLVMILPSKQTFIELGTIIKIEKGRLNCLLISVCGKNDWYRQEDVTLVNRGFFDLLKEHLKTHEPAYERDEVQQAVNENDFEKMTAIIRKANKVDERVCEYKLTTTIDDLQVKENKERYLNPHHHLFVLVEDSTLNKFGGEIEFRAMLEKQISSEILRSRIK